MITKAYTQKFDEMIQAEELCEAEELARLRAYLDKQLSNLQGPARPSVVSPNRLQRRLMAAAETAPGISISKKAFLIPRA